MIEARQIGRPPAFDSDLGRVVFSKFHRVEHQIVVDAASGNSRARTWIDLETDRVGHPVIELDSAPDHIKVRIDGVKTKMVVVDSPGSMRDYEFQPLAIARYLVPERKLATGRHRVEIVQNNPKGIQVVDRRVDVEFRMYDISVPDTDRFRHHYLGRYLPSNLEFDQHPRAIELFIDNCGNRHELWTNGAVTGDGFQRWRVEFPAHYTSACPFFVVAPAGKYPTTSWVFDGKSRLGIRVFGNPETEHPAFVKKAETILQDLEGAFGPFPHQDLLIFANGGRGGMEYCAAVESTLDKLKHELAHCYFGRCILPGNGDAGWIDEAIAGWIADRQGRTERPIHQHVLADFSPYRRGASPVSYTIGSQFVGYLDERLTGSGGMQQFLEAWVSRRRFQIVDTEIMIRDLEQFSGVAVREDFEAAIYNYDLD